MGLSFLPQTCSLREPSSNTMIEFQIPAMSCNHCAQAITQAVQAADPAAELNFDLPSKRVSVQSTADRQALVEQLTEAGYPPA
jgi:copper chaperone